MTSQTTSDGMRDTIAMIRSHVATCEILVRSFEGSLRHSTFMLQHSADRNARRRYKRQVVRYTDRLAQATKTLNAYRRMLPQAD